MKVQSLHPNSTLSQEKGVASHAASHLQYPIARRNTRKAQQFVHVSLQAGRIPGHHGPLQSALKIAPLDTVVRFKVGWMGLLIGEMARLKCDFSFLRRSFHRDIEGCDRQGIGFPLSGRVNPPKPKGTRNSRRTFSTVPSATAVKILGVSRSIARSFRPTYTRGKGKRANAQRLLRRRPRSRSVCRRRTALAPGPARPPLQQAREPWEEESHQPPPQSPVALRPLWSNHSC